MEDGAYAGVAGGAYAIAAFSPENGRPHEGRLAVKVHTPDGGRTEGRGRPDAAPAESREFWAGYFDFARDYGAIKRRLAASGSAMAEAVAYGAGIRILEQDPWEALISFIVSQNNHIPRIRGCIENICRHFGERREYGGVEYFTFPKAEGLAEALMERGIDALAPCGLGYRAKYIAEATRQVIERGGEGYLEGLKSQRFEEAMKEITSIHGVGPKVASCVLLFGLGKREGFPVDVWIARAMKEFYGIGENDRAAAEAYAKEHFGDAAGIAQQYLFYYARSQK
jgi:N-glycosylase/DNA lyase